jgi:DNA-binding MarR family transcriptional regulator
MSSEAAESVAVQSLVEELLRSTGQLIRRLRTETTPGELTWSQIAALARLDQLGPMTTADLARVEGVKPQSMGATLAGLERDALVAREPHPTDGRQALYDLTQRGREVREQRKLLKRAWLSAAMAELDDDEKRALTAAVKVMGRLANAPHTPSAPE